MLMRTRPMQMGLSVMLSVALLTACGKKTEVAATSGPAANVTAERLTNAASEPAQWMTYGGTYSEQRFSQLKKIDSGNVGTLGLQWFADYTTNQNQHGSPLFVDGVLYVSTARNVVHAFDGKTGQMLWTYNPNIQGERLRSNLGLVNRGLAAWNGKIIMGTLDARLVAIDAKTGKPAWDIDVVPESLGLGDMGNKYSITMAPRIAKGKVFIGGSGGEFGVRGFIAAYDADTGKEAWRFWTVPGDPAKGFESKALETAAKTWEGEWWKVAGGGGTVWDGALYDPETDLLMFGTGNPTPWNARARASKVADNLYAASIVALRPDTGEYVWHYQTTPGDSWDYDATSPMMTMDLTLDGAKKHVLVQPSKNGFLYVLNAADGKLLSADPFTEVNWATGIDMKTGRPIEVDGSRYEKEPWNVSPGAPGGHTWHPNAYSPDTGLIYIPTWENYGAMADLPKEFKPTPGRFSIGVSFGGQGLDRSKLKPYDRRADTGLLRAWDPVARKIVWESEPGPRATSGVLATAGNLVFMGNGPGKTIFAYDAKIGREAVELRCEDRGARRADQLRARRRAVRRGERRRHGAGRLLRADVRAHAGVRIERQGGAARVAALHAAAARSAGIDRFGRRHRAGRGAVHRALQRVPRRGWRPGAHQLPEPHRDAAAPHAGGLRPGGARRRAHREGHGLVREVPAARRQRRGARVHRVARAGSEEQPAAVGWPAWRTGCAGRTATGAAAAAATGNRARGVAFVTSSRASVPR